MTSDGALHLAGLEARRAHVETLGRPRDDGTNALDVRVPAPLRAHVRVRDAVPEARALGADVAVGSHGLLLLLLRMCRWIAAKSMGLSWVRAHERTVSVPSLFARSDRSGGRCGAHHQCPTWPGNRSRLAHLARRPKCGSHAARWGPGRTRQAVRTTGSRRADDRDHGGAGERV